MMLRIGLFAIGLLLLTATSFAQEAKTSKQMLNETKETLKKAEEPKHETIKEATTDLTSPDLEVKPIRSKQEEYELQMNQSQRKTNANSKSEKKNAKTTN
jgi:Sec-independent protein translocase protein TatA